MADRDIHSRHPPLPMSGDARTRSFGPQHGESSTFSTRGQRLQQIIQDQAFRHPSLKLRKSMSGTSSSTWADEEADAEQSGVTPVVTEEERRQIRRARTKRASVSGDGRGIDLESPGMMDDESFDGAREILPPETPIPPENFPLTRALSISDEVPRSDRRASILVTPQMRSQRLIGNSNPRYRWEQYYKTDEELKRMKKSLRKYYERNNFLIIQYLYIDRLLDSSLPYNLIQEYGENQAQQKKMNIPPTISEEDSPSSQSIDGDPLKSSESLPDGNDDKSSPAPRIKRTKSIYRVNVDESTPLLSSNGKLTDGGDIENDVLPAFQAGEESDSEARVVTIAIYINLAANTLLLALKIVVTILTSSLSVLASLVDAALDFLSTAIVWTTTRLISSSRSERDKYPVGRQRLEPLGVLVFSVIMITSFFQVALEALNRLAGPDRTVVQLSPAAVAIMASTVVVKGLCWFWCRLVKNSSVQALAQDAVTDVVFNMFSIIFPLLGYFAKIWWLDPLGGLLLSLYVIVSWSLTTRTHILNLVGQTASADERNILLYLTMRFAKCIRKIQNIAVYHAGDKLNVEVDIVLDEDVIGDCGDDQETLKPGARALRDIHDLGESLQYVLESVPGVERAFVHSDYWEGNLPSHMSQ